MSFVDEEGIMQLIEELLLHILAAAGVDAKPVLPLPRMSYFSALSQVRVKYNIYSSFAVQCGLFSKKIGFLCNQLKFANKTTVNLD